MTPIVSMYAYHQHQQDTSQVPRGVRFNFLDIAVTQHDTPRLTEMHRQTSARACDATAGSQTMRLHQLVIVSGQLSSTEAAKQAAAQNHPSPVPVQKHVCQNEPQGLAVLIRTRGPPPAHASIVLSFTSYTEH